MATISKKWRSRLGERISFRCKPVIVRPPWHTYVGAEEIALIYRSRSGVLVDIAHNTVDIMLMHPNIASTVVRVPKKHLRI